MIDFAKVFRSGKHGQILLTLEHDPETKWQITVIAVRGGDGLVRRRARVWDKHSLEDGWLLAQSEFEMLKASEAEAVADEIISSDQRLH